MNNLQEDFELICTNCNNNYGFLNYLILLLYIVDKFMKPNAANVTSKLKKIQIISFVTEI